jgi:predicted glycoside hydrolase/deacetylase ChbG (UPF0249 family)
VPDVKRLIVNADDFGRTAGINQGVIEAHRRGIVTSATLMVAHPAAAEAAKLAVEAAGLGVGLHLAFTGGPSVLPASELPSLVGATGGLPARVDELAVADPGEILDEARAQLKRFRELLGRSPTHLDSHHHAHRFPAALEALLTLAWETGLPVRSLTAEMRARFARERIPTADRFVESFYGDGATLEGLLRILASLNFETTELMCHPAVVDDALLASSSYAEPRSRELAILNHQEARHAIQAAGIRLIHYGELATD